jgi:hypothetical protein
VFCRWSAPALSLAPRRFAAMAGWAPVRATPLVALGAARCGGRLGRRGGRRRRQRDRGRWWDGGRALRRLRQGSRPAWGRGVRRAGWLLSSGRIRTWRLGPRRARRRLAGRPNGTRGRSLRRLRRGRGALPRRPGRGLRWARGAGGRIGSAGGPPLGSAGGVSLGSLGLGRLLRGRRGAPLGGRLAALVVRQEHRERERGHPRRGDRGHAGGETCGRRAGPGGD